MEDKQILMTSKVSNILAVTLIIISAVLLRLIPHLPNFTPIAAMAIFGGVYLSKKWSLVLPLTIMLISDYLLLYIHPFGSPTVDFSKLQPIQALVHSTTFFVYLSFLISGFLGTILKNISKLYTPIFSLVASIQFFIITNLGVWLTVGTYPKTLEGLLTCFVVAIPFFKNTIMGDLFYTGLLFGSLAAFRLIFRLKFANLYKS